MPQSAPGEHLPAADAPNRGSPLDVLFAFLKLGLISCGGPVAHVGYFRTEFVEHRRGLHDKS